MSIKVLSQATALNPGHDLWAFPQMEKSKWAQNLDWYQNFAWTKAIEQKKKELSPELLRIIKEEEVKLPKLNLKKQPPLMVATSSYFPNQQNLQLPFSVEKRDQWVDELKAIWEQLLHPKMRIFLPKDISPEEFEAIWSDPKTHDKLSIVSEA